MIYQNYFTRLLQHFYCKEVSKEEFLKIEQVSALSDFNHNTPPPFKERPDCWGVRGGDPGPTEGAPLHQAQEQVGGVSKAVTLTGPAVTQPWAHWRLSYVHMWNFLLYSPGHIPA